MTQFRVETDSLGEVDRPADMVDFIRGKVYRPEYPTLV